MAYSSDTQNAPVLSTEPDGRLALIALPGIAPLGQKVNDFLVEWRRGRVAEGLCKDENGYARDSFLVPVELPRFGSGEAKAIVKETVRGDDLYILVDVTNHSLTYKLGEELNYMSPDDHFQDLKRVIGAIGNSVRRINVVMPYLYEGRQQTRNARESLDCANMLQELMDMGVNNVLTFDAHDPRVQNAIPLGGFESFLPTYQFIKNILRLESDTRVDSEHLIVVSPDEGGMNRAIIMANMLEVDMGMFYQRRDYSTVVSGTNPIVAYEFLGPDPKGKDLIILDDMISSGRKVLKIAEILKERGARRIFICASFGVFTSGFEYFDKAYEKGNFDHLITTNLIYQPEELLEKPYYLSCDMSKFIALIIDTLNHDATMSGLLNPVDRIKKTLEKHREALLT